ncbi:MAG: peptidoglycan DD-metalloendopeptidase family protein [Deltaproteobacteria bacterium]|nr:peptidoglycan DD-metalloendopeptidase family protein [Deltaproteobacteria bacterium]MBW2216099.1 peptidoglycan DD-metalloendopeptidase family protein [Deltaproteobacteria bacterium]
MRKVTIVKLIKNPAPPAFFPLFFFLFIPLLSFHGFHASKAIAKQDQIKIIESNLSREKQQYDKFDSREKDLLSRVSELELDVAEKKGAIEELREKIRLEKSEIKKLGKEQARLEASLLDTEIKAAKRLVALYKYARKGYVKTLADVMDMEQLWQRVIYLRAISEEDRKDLTKLAEEVLVYKKKISQIKEKIAKKEAAEKQENERQAAMRGDLEEKVLRLMRIHKEKEFYETAVKELQLAAVDLKKTFSHIEKKKQYKATWSSRFADSKRKLPFPLEGKIIRGDKLLGPKNQNFNKGVFIESSDTDVKAVFPGRVDFSGQLKGYGEIIIINHGSRYFTISAQLYQRTKEEGDEVDSGEVIGFVSQSGSSKKTRVYFEIRKAGKSLNPLSWLKKR